MLEKENRLISLLGKQNWVSSLIYLVIFLILIMPISYLVYSGYTQQEVSFRKITDSERSNIVEQGALLIEERFIKLEDIAKSLASRVQMRRLIAEGKWEEAIEILKDIPNIYPEIERVFLADTKGILTVDTPAAPGSVRGQDFSYRDWYKGVSSEWKTYVSEAFQRAALPPYNVINVATPIYDENNELLGILVLQIRLETLEQWAKNIIMRTEGFLYFIDQHGHAIGHPDYPPSTIKDLSTEPVVSMAMEGRAGNIEYRDKNGQDLVVGYKGVKRFGWGVLLVQNVDDAYAAMHAALKRHLWIGLCLLSLSILIIFLMTHFMRSSYMSEQRQLAMLQSIGDGVIAIDKDFKIILWNRAASLISGYSSDEALGKPFRKIMKLCHESDHKENFSFLEEAMLSGKVKQMENHTLLKNKQGAFVSVADSAAPIFSQNGAVIGAIIVFRDVSQERNIEKAKDEFISTASHQLRTPLTGMKWMLKLLLKETDKMSNKQKDYIKKLNVEADRLGGLVKALLDTSRLDTGSFSVETKATDFVELAEESVREIEVELTKNNLKIKKEFAKKIPLIEADPKLITIIYQNLLSNAVKYSKKTGKIEFSIQKSRNSIVIKVKDNGVGIPLEDQSLIFSKMYRAKNAQEIEGTGLGLYMVKSIVEFMKGSIRFNSIKNKGTTFIVELPLSGIKTKKTS